MRSESAWFALLTLPIWLLAAACSQAPTEVPLADIETAVAGTMQAEAELASTVAARVKLTVSAIAREATETEAARPTATPTITPTPTQTLTPTPSIVSVSVSNNTNCRSGPAPNYAYRGSLLVGETVLVTGKNQDGDYWYIDNPDQPGESCWLWGEHVTLVGDPQILPIYTPLPSPTVGPPFTLRFDGMVTCGGEHAVFKIHNTSRRHFMTASRQVTDLDTGEELYPAELDRHPFAPGPSDCPPGHSNRFPPDRVAYIYIPLESAPGGHAARATIKVCSEDYLGGDCYTQRVDFRIP